MTDRAPALGIASSEELHEEYDRPIRLNRNGASCALCADSWSRVCVVVGLVTNFLNASLWSWQSMGCLVERVRASGLPCTGGAFVLGAHAGMACCARR